MVEADRFSKLYDIIRNAAISISNSSVVDRREVYNYARRAVIDLYELEGSSADPDKNQIIEELEKIFNIIESEEFLVQNEYVSSPESGSLPPSSILDSTSMPGGGRDANRNNLPHERTTLFLKNIGTGGLVSVVKILVQLALLPTMAHLLGPKEFGVYALAVPVVAFLTVIADGGVGLSLARDRTNAPDIWSTAFWILLASGIMLSVFVVACGHLMSLASSEPQLNTVMLILAMSFPFLTLTVLPVARLTRRGNLIVCAIADFVATMVGAICAVVLGVMGFGAKSLAFQFLAGYVVRAIIINLYAFERPSAVFRPSAMLGHMSSGGILMGGRIADLACRSVEGLLFGNIFGAATLGAYNFANQVPRFLFEAFSNPTWTALYAQSLSEHHERLLQIYYKVCRLMAFFTFPTAAVLTAASPEILAQILSPSWQQAGSFLRILAPGYALNLTASMGTALFLAFNANFVFFLTTAFLAISRVLAVAAGYYLPVLGSVWFVTISNVIYAFVVCGLVVRIADARLINIIKEIAGFLFAALVSGTVCWSILSLGSGTLGILCAAVSAAVVSYFFVVFAIEGNNLRSEFIFLKSAVIKKRP